MKRLAIAALMAFGAVSLHADQTTTAAPAPPQKPDSPLVRAAKSSGRSTAKNKKKIVITNDTLVKSGGHITTGVSTPAALPPPPPEGNPLEKLANEQIRYRQNAEAKAKKEAEEKQKTAAERANALYEGDDSDAIFEDPTTTEARMKKDGGEQPQQPQPMSTQQPPTVKVAKPPE